MHIRSITRHSIKPSRHFNFRLSFLIAGVALLLLFKPGFCFANGLAGTWSGTLTNGDKSESFQLMFSPAGHYVVTYTNNNGKTNQIELTTAGQKIQFVPPGGGVAAITLESISPNAQGISLLISYSFEKASGGYLDQRYGSEAIECQLTTNGLAVQITSKTKNHLADKQLSTVSDGETSVAAGTLQKIQ